MYTEILDFTESKDQPLIYKIEIGNPSDNFYRFYVGKSSRGHKRPLKKYLKCVKNFENNKYRKIYRNKEIVGTRPAWRDNVHPHLSEAIKNKWPIKLTMQPSSLQNLDFDEKTILHENIQNHGKERTLNIKLV